MSEPENAIEVPTEQERVMKAALLGVILGAVLAFLARRRERA